MNFPCAIENSTISTITSKQDLYYVIHIPRH